MSSMGRVVSLVVVVVLVSLVSLAGCTVGSSQQAHNDQKPTVNVVPPAPSPDRTGEVSQRIDASANNTQNALSGLMNVSVSKLESVLKGIEAHLSLAFNALNNMHLRMDNTVAANATANADLKAELKIMSSVVADMKVTVNTQLQVINDMKVQLGNLNTTAQVSANAQVGLSNKIETAMTTMNAGRDVNMLPKEAVDVIKINAYITMALITLIGSLVTLFFRSWARSEQDDKVKLYGLVLKLLTVPPEEHRREIEKVLGAVKP